MSQIIIKCTQKQMHNGNFLLFFYAEIWQHIAAWLERITL